MPSALKNMLRIFKAHPSMIVPIFISRLINFGFVMLIALPLIKAYAEGDSSSSLVKATEGFGINLHSPSLYLIILFLFFINNIISTLLYSISIISLLDYFRAERFSLTKGLKGIFKRFFAIVSWCAINKSIGLVVRLWDAIADFAEHPLIKSYNWQHGTFLSLLFILDKNCSPKAAVKKSKALVQENTEGKLQFSPKISKIFLKLWLCSTLPLIIALCLYTQKSILIGGLITTLCWFLISGISTLFNLIILSVFYEHWAHKKQRGGFDEAMLKSIMKSR